MPSIGNNMRLALRLVLFACVALLSLAPRASAQSAVPRSEVPRPDFVRADWQTLNGRWEFEFDDSDGGVAERWYAPASAKRFTKTINVPFAFQSKSSGIGDTSFHDVVWYRRALRPPDTYTRAGRRTLLKFGAVDYEADVWVNGEHAGSHRGGNVGFSLDITDYMKAGDNTLVVRAY